MYQNTLRISTIYIFILKLKIAKKLAAVNKKMIP